MGSKFRVGESPITDLEAVFQLSVLIFFSRCFSCSRPLPIGCGRTADAFAEVLGEAALIASGLVGTAAAGACIFSLATATPRLPSKQSTTQRAAIKAATGRSTVLAMGTASPAERLRKRAHSTGYRPAGPVLDTSLPTRLHGLVRAQFSSPFESTPAHRRAKGPYPDPNP